jgi:hypothetical protein
MTENNIFTRAATFEPSTFDEKKRTVQVVFSTGADVMRSDWEGPYLERLSLEPAAVDLSKLIGGPVLDNHDRFSGVRSILGVVETAAVDGKRGVADLRFSERPEVQGVMADVGSGVIRSVSAGYSVQKWEVSKRADGTRIKTATRWTPVEVSFTPLAADAGAQTRGKNMIETLQTQIRSLVDLAGLPATFGEDLITRNCATIEEARTAVFAEAAKKTPATQPQAPAVVTRDAGDGLVTRLADGLLSRMDPAHKPEAGRAYAYHRISDIAREVLQLRGLSTLGAPAELITRAMHGTADFSNVLSEVFNKSLLTLRTAATPLQQVFKRTTMADFRARHVLEISDGPALLKMGEGSQLTYGQISDKELASYAIDSYARGFAITFKALVNDNIQALSDVSAKMTRGARGWFAGFLADVIIANPALTDTNACFHATHNNLAAAGAAPSDTTLGAAKLAMRLQTDLTGNVIDAMPKYLVIAAAREVAVEKLLATLYPASSAAVENAAKGLTPIVVPHFDKATPAHVAWYLFADPSVAPVFEYAELSGYEGPQVETRQGFDTLGTEVRVVWHVGAGAIDSRGAYKNPGV